MLKEFSKKETNRYELVITVDAATFGEAIKKAYKQNGKKINVPGFRKGKAPMSIIEKYYGESVFFEDALNIIIIGAGKVGTVLADTLSKEGNNVTIVDKKPSVISKRQEPSFRNDSFAFD